MDKELTSINNNSLKNNTHNNFNINNNDELYKESNKLLILIANSIKGKLECEDYRRNFIVSRNNPISKYIDPTQSLVYSKEFLNCYTSMLNNVYKNNNCIEKLSSIVVCLKKNLKNEFPSKCISEMEQYINC